MGARSLRESASARTALLAVRARRSVRRLGGAELGLGSEHGDASGDRRPAAALAVAGPTASGPPRSRDESPTAREATEPRGPPAIARRSRTSDPSLRVRDTRLASSASPSSCIGRASRREPRSRRPGGSSGSRRSTTRRRRPRGAFAPGWSRPTTAASPATSTTCADSSRWRGGAPASSPSRPGTRRMPAQSPCSSSTRSPDCSTELSAIRRPPRSRSRESTALSDRSWRPHRPRSWSWSS